MPTLSEVLTEASKDHRVCPQPDPWNKLWQMLPGRKRKGAGWEPPLPLILGAWWHTSDTQKRDRFQAHLRWADEHDALNDLFEYLFSLNTEDWHREE